MAWHSENLLTLMPGVPTIDLEGLFNPVVCPVIIFKNSDGVNVLSFHKNEFYPFTLIVLTCY